MKSLWLEGGNFDISPKLHHQFIVEGKLMSPLTHLYTMLSLVVGVGAHEQNRSPSLVEVPLEIVINCAKK